MYKQKLPKIDNYLHSHLDGYYEVTKIEDCLHKHNFDGYYEVNIERNGVVAILVEWGDWKHQHTYLRTIMASIGYTEIDEVVTEEDGSDCYSAMHYFEAVDVSQFCR